MIAKNHPVPCLVEEESDATIVSTIENVQRAAMHPADEFEAFASLIDEGHGEEDIATRFGVSVSVVRKRLKLARVAPDIFEAFRNGDISLDCIMAFTISDHQDRQLKVWESLRDRYHVNANAIRHMLTQTAYSAGSGLGRFVGVEAYEAAGGVVLRDLFCDGDETYLENAELVEKLALEKLQAAKQEYCTDWKWVDVYFDLDYDAFRSFGRVYPQDDDPDPKVTEEQEALYQRLEELDVLEQAEGLTDEQEQEYRLLEGRIESLDNEIAAARSYAQQDREIAGVVLAVDWSGKLQVEKGLVRPEDIPPADENGDRRITTPASSAPTPVSDPATALRKAEGVPNSLADDLRTARHHILRAHLGANYDMAFDVLLYTMCRQVFDGYREDYLPLDLSLTPYHAKNHGQVVEGSMADHMITRVEGDLRVDWLTLEPPHDFRAMCDLSRDEKQALFAFTASFALKAQLSDDTYPSPVIEEIGLRMDVDVAGCWRPTAANYWGTVTKAHIASIATQIVGDDFAKERRGEKKLDAATVMERAFGEDAVETGDLDEATAAKAAKWLPRGMAFEATATTDEADATAADEVVEPDDEDLPPAVSESAA